jgi:hypothetical protein
MPTIDLTDEECAAVIYALNATINRDHFPHSPRLTPFRSALVKFDSVPPDRAPPIRGARATSWRAQREAMI